MRLFFHGIGFIYIGSKNFQIRTGPCPHCRRTGTLSSYDTRKWFVFVLVPMVPLERLRIIDYCRVCSKHLVVPLGEWERAKQSGISDALNRFQSSPTAETAIMVHQQLLGFHQSAAAETFRKQARLKFPDDANLHVCFGADLERLGLPGQADECFQRAHELRPDLPAARLGWAGGLIRAGKLNEARELLDILEIPGAAKTHPIEPLYQLATAYQSANQHEAALELFAVLLREQPHLQENVLFRDRVQESERSIRPKNELASLSHLSGRPRASSSGKAIKIGMVVIGGTLLIAAISNESIRRQRDLYVVNTYGQAATLQISGLESRVVQGLAKICLKEGTYRALVSGPVQEEIEFTIRDNYWHRWSGHPIWVLNLGGKTILQLTSATYARTTPPPPSEQYFYGKKFWHFANVTHPFDELPGQIYNDRGTTPTLTSLSVMSASPTDLFAYYVEMGNISAALSFAEWQLSRPPKDQDLMAIYSEVARQTDPNRLNNFLQTNRTQ